jgi:hypothetical protein
MLPDKLILTFIRLSFVWPSEEQSAKSCRGGMGWRKLHFEFEQFECRP